MMINGCSTGCPPVYVSVSKPATSSQNRHWLRDGKAMLQWAFCLLLFLFCFSVKFYLLRFNNF